MSGQSSGSGCKFVMSVVVHGDSALNEQEKELNQRLRRLYPAVSEQETPLPRSWSPKDKFSYIGLSQNNLRVHYKGHGKTPKDAASVRATHPIPAACGVYYFEVKIISKGRDGYMGIGLSAQGVNMNRLPGWDKHSYGYHGDDGHSFCSSGTGQPYGPTFTTGDVIGCCVNLINNTCFYTKNGHSLGIAFTDLPERCYIVMMVASYLVHHSYCATAEAFAKSTDQAVHEELASIKNRQKIQKLVLSGRMGEAIETTQQLYPSLLERNPDLLFMLKVRQFIEMVNGTDSEVRCLGGRSPKSQDSYPGSPRPFSSPSHKASSSQSYLTGFDSNCCNGVTSNKSHSSSPHSHKPCPPASASTLPASDISLNGSRSQLPLTSNDVDMEVDHFTNGVTESSSNGFLNGSSKHTAEPDDCDADMEVESAQSKRQLCGGSQAAIERMIHFGRELQSMSEHLRRECGKNSANKKMLKDAFSLLAYSDPWSSPVGYQLDSIQREPVCSTLNSAILETHNLPKQPPLAQAVGQAAQCLSIMARTGSGSCAFASVDDYLH
ncbi:ran-binding protein 9 [Scomber japonicus]|uniref:ran-binding protein 9 n=1 Tax=Scomber japonicus TaxID=13676 RepID=UPI0023054407|nr:ran-binding protein 9 [Scomber japonicus]